MRAVSDTKPGQWRAHVVAIAGFIVGLLLILAAATTAILGVYAHGWAVARLVVLAATVSAVGLLMVSLAAVYANVVRAMNDRKWLDEARLRLADIVESSDDAIISKDLDGTILSWNAGAQRVYGYTAGEIVGKSIRVLLPPDRPEEERILQRLCLGERLEPFETVQVTKGGRRIDVLVTVSPMKDGDGKVIGAWAIVRDISERKRAEGGLRESEAKYRSLFENMLDGFAYCQMLFDDHDRPKDFVYLEVNEAFRTLTGLKDVVGRKASEVIPGIREMHPELLEIYGRVARTGRSERFEIELKPLSMWLLIAVYGPGAGHFVATFDNITDRKRAEQQLKELNETLERRVVERTAELERRSDQLRALASQLTQAERKERQRIAYILHEHFQQLLVGAKFTLSTTRNEVGDPDLQATIQEVDKVLSEAIEESRSLAIDLSPPILYRSSMSHVLRWLGQWMHEKHSLTVHVRAEEQVDPRDPQLRELLFQGVRELLLNVIKYAGIGQATVRMDQTQDGRVRITVSDEGAGFDVSRYRSEGGGKGFGLFNIEERLELMGGRLEIDSVPGQGSRFTLLAPAEQPKGRAEPAGELVVEKAAAETGGDTGILPGAAAQAERIRVLLADDHAVVRDGLARLLQMHADILVVGTAANGQEAVEMASRVRPDVILMDVSMPLLDGIEATRQVRRRMEGVSVIGLSMYDEKEMMRRMREAGAAYYLTKTAPPDTVVATIRQCVRRGAA